MINIETLGTRKITGNISSFIMYLLTPSANTVIVEICCIGVLIPSGYLIIDAFWTQPGQNLNDTTFKAAWLSFFPCILLLLIFNRIITKTFNINSELIILSLTWFLVRLNFGAGEDKLHIQIALNESYILLIQSLIPRFVVQNIKKEWLFISHKSIIIICCFAVFSFLTLINPLQNIVYAQSILVLLLFTLVVVHRQVAFFADATVLRLFYVLLTIMALIIDQISISGDMFPTGTIAISLGHLINMLHISKYKLPLNVILQTMLISSILYWYVGDFEIISIFLITNLFLIFSVNLNSRPYFSTKIVNPIIISMLAMCSCVLLDTYIFGKNSYYIYTIIVLLVISLSLTLGRRFRTTTSIFRIASLALVVFTVFFLDQNYQYEAYHQGFFLGPILDLVNGRSPLVNINAQYGVGVFYGFAALFGMSADNVTFAYFSRLLGFVDLIYPIMFVIILAPIVNNRILAFICVACGNLIYHANPDSGLLPQMFPSTGAFRFAIGYLPIIAYIYLINKKRYVFFTSVAISLFITWSIEAGMSMLISAIVIVFVTEYFDTIRSWRPFVIMFLYLLSGLFGWGLLTALTYIREGRYPALAHYLEFTALYGSGFGWVSPGLHAAWSLYGLLIALALLFAIIMRSSAWHDPGTSPAVFKQKITVLVALSLISYAQGAYYVYRAHTSNLYHILWPSLMIGIILIDTLIYEADNRQMSRYTAMSVLMSFGIYSGYKTIEYSSQLPYTIFGKGVRSWNLLINNSDSEFVMTEEKIYKSMYLLTERDLELHEYLISHQDKEKEITLFVSEESLIRARLGTRVNNKIMSSFIPQDEIVPIGRNMMYESLKDINNEENIVIALNSLTSPGLLPGLVIELCKSKTGIINNISKHFAYVKIVDAGSGGGDICKQIWGYYNDK